MADVVELGQITCPSGELVLTDGGYLGTWSGNDRPEDARWRPGPAADLEVVGPDAQIAARSFDRQSGTRLYDIPDHGVEQVTSDFTEHGAGPGLDARLRPFPDQVPHRERVRHAIREGDPDFTIFGVPVLAVGDVPTGTPLRVTAAYGTQGWSQIRIELRDAPVARSEALGPMHIDHARFVFADADALGSWIHDRPIDGLADVAFWGRDQEELAAMLGASLLPEGVYGWLDLPGQEALERARDLDRRRRAADRPTFMFDLRPHSHHWQVMATVRASEHEAGTITVAGAEIMMAMTSIGDGLFPAHLDRDAHGTPVAVTIAVDAS